LTVNVKICGLTEAASVAACAAGGAKFLGFVFVPQSRHNIAPVEAASLIAQIPHSIQSVGLFVDPTDEEILAVLRDAPVRMIQLHGNETPERAAAIKNLTGLPIIKAIGVAALRDVLLAHAYEPVADYLLLDAKPRAGGSSGGNGVAFDWNLLKEAGFSKPWFLAGGLNFDNIEAAVQATGAQMLDVSSGVEDEAGRKNPLKIKSFLLKARSLETGC
jgi:phosphoribosylanthranilate isomerase